MAQHAAWLTSVAVIAAALCLTAATVPAAAAVPLESRPDVDAAVLRALRAAIAASDPDWTACVPGWLPGSLEHPCAWEGVECDADQHVTELVLTASLLRRAWPPYIPSKMDLPPSPLLPELASLPRLSRLGLVRYGAWPWPAFPQEWLAVGAFPALKSLSLTGRSLAGPLPVVVPGALAQLQTLALEFPELVSTLPPSWGADPAVLPSLRELEVAVQIEGGLPAEWTRGFRLLRRLSVATPPPGFTPPDIKIPRSERAAWTGNLVASLEARRAAGLSIRQQPSPGTTPGLPDAWARAGAFPSLHQLSVTNLALGGSLPQAWVDGGFPKLLYMCLGFCDLTGTLPPQLFARHPYLEDVQLGSNNLAGPLPLSWGDNPKALRIGLDHNALTGPAFPATWIAPGALRHLATLDLTGNAALTGALPANLSWPNLKVLLLDNTRVSGSVPSAWCSAPFATQLYRLKLNGSAADPALPPCAEKDMHRLWDTQAQSKGTYRSRSTPYNRQQGSSHAAAATLAGLLPAVALLVVGLAGRLLWQRRLRRQLHVRAGKIGAQEEAWSLIADERTAANGSDSSSIDWECTRRTRMERLLTAQLGPDGALHVTLEAAPAALAHQLAAVSEDERAPEAGAPATPRDIELGRSPSLAANNLQAAGSRRWALGTTSLQLRAGEVEFCKDDQGRLAVLGVGTHAVVYEARLHGGEVVAAKVFELLPGQDSRAAWHEAALLRECIHSRIVPLYGVAIKGPLLMLVTRRMEGGSLTTAFQIPERREALRWRAGGRQVAIDVTDALDHLHREMHVLHGDLKPSNVLLTGSLRACIGDLGIAQTVGSRARTAGGFCCTHAAPEQLMGERCGVAADVYALGILLVELTTGTLVQRRGSWHLPAAPAECSPAVLALIEECILQDPAARPSAAEALQRLRADSDAASKGAV